MLIRSVGPALGTFGVVDAIADPTLALFNSAGVQVNANDNWADAPNPAELRAAIVGSGAFALAEGSRDSALLATLDPGVYTAQATGVAGASGVGLLEIYEVP